MTKLLTTGFIFHQDGVPAHTVCRAQEWIRANCCCKGSVDFKFAGSKPLGLSCVGCNVGGLLQTSNKAVNNRRTQGST